MVFFDHCISKLNCEKHQLRRPSIGIKSAHRLVVRNSHLAKDVDAWPPDCRLLQIRSFGSQEFRRLYKSGDFVLLIFVASGHT